MSEIIKGENEIMIENIKPIAFVPESTGVRVISRGSCIYAVRTDRITTIAEKLTFLDNVVNNVDCIVDYNQFAALISEAKEMEQCQTYLRIVLKNGGEYKLEFLDLTVKFPDIPELPEDAQTKVFNFKPLSIACLQSHLSNDLRNVYVNSNGAYSTNFLIAAHTDQLNEEGKQLYPADILGDIAGKFQVAHKDASLYVANETFILKTVQPILEDEESFLLIAEMFNEQIDYQPAKQLPDQLKRIAMFDEVITFKGDKLISRCGIEPSPVTTDEPIEFDIQPLLPVIADAEQIGFSKLGHMYIKKGSLTYMASRRDVE